jgi:hypothetical protein
VSEKDTLETDNADQALGARIVLSAVSAPLRKMASNAGLSVDLTEKRVKESETGSGYNFATGEVTDLYEAGVIDPLKVTKTALLNAVSAAGTLITTSHGIVESE